MTVDENIETLDFEEEILEHKQAEEFQTSISKKEIKDLFVDAVTAYKNKNIERAVTLFQNILNANPNQVEALINLGNCVYQMKNVNDAVEFWQRALTIDDSFIVCYLNIGNAYYSRGQIHEAINIWIKGSIKVPDEPKLLRNIGAAYDKIGDKINAFRYYEQYLKYSFHEKTLERRNFQARLKNFLDAATNNYRVARSAQKKKSLKIAAIAYHKAIKAYPLIKKAYLNLGTIFYMAEKYENAVKYWINGIILGDGEEETICSLGIAYEKLGLYEEAFCAYQRYLYVSKGLGFASKELSKRIKILKKYLDKKLTDNKNQLRLAEKYYKKNNYLYALWYYENHLFLNHTEDALYRDKINEIRIILDPIQNAFNFSFDIANSCFAKREYERAFHAYSRCTKLDPSSKELDICRSRMTKCAKIINNSPKLRK
ncbi:MAG: tetratricopeptide repeat protein [Candidatus Gastranaerophilales bacterium]|nr:tetratricopeptide repeat protein [Candidatus Gastranaerophilales bacterium]